MMEMTVKAAARQKRPSAEVSTVAGSVDHADATKARLFVTKLGQSRSRTPSPSPSPSPSFKGKGKTTRISDVPDVTLVTPAAGGLSNGDGSSTRKASLAPTTATTITTSLFGGGGATPSGSRNGSVGSILLTSFGGHVPSRNSSLTLNVPSMTVNGEVMLDASELQGNSASAQGAASAPATAKSRSSGAAGILVKKTVSGVSMLTLATAFWVCWTHFVKATYTNALKEELWPADESNGNVTTPASAAAAQRQGQRTYDAPFFTTWFCSLGIVFFLPVYLLARVLTGANKAGLKATFRDSLHGFREKGLGLAKFLGRCCLFSMLWTLTQFLLVYSLRVLGCTEVMALFATNVSFIYLLSWVVLHEHFVGIRIVAVILSNTGIALLAYMDGINQTPTLGGVVLVAAGAAGFATYKVMLKRVLGEASACQVSIFFTMVGLCSILLSWPIMLALTLSGVETLHWDSLPWDSLSGALAFSLAAHMISSFGSAFAHENFVTMGVLMAVPACAGLDVYLYEATFQGMKLAGIVLIACGFVVVLFPSNWPDGILKLISLGRRAPKDGDLRRKATPDLRTGYVGSRLRSPSGRVR